MKVVVVGAGYAGTIAANRLAKKLSDVDITVINPRADFIERVRLHEQIAGSGRAQVYASLGLRLDYDPHLRRVQATADLSRVAGCVRGGV